MDRQLVSKSQSGIGICLLITDRWLLISVLRRPGGICGEPVPDPIPNSAVNLLCANGTKSRRLGRVGRCQACQGRKIGRKSPRHDELYSVIAYQKAALRGGLLALETPLRIRRRLMFVPRSCTRDAVDFHIERAVPRHDTEEAARRRIGWKIARVHGVDRREMCGIGAIHIALDDLVER